MKTKIITSFLALFFSNFSFGDEVLWLELQTVLSYRDLSMNCSSGHYPKSLYFAAEVSNGEIKRAVLTNDMSPLLSSSTELSAEEIKSVELLKSSNARTWLKQIELGAKSLQWLLFNGGGGEINGCKPTQPLSTLAPQKVVFEFNLNDILLLPALSESSVAKLQGQLKNQDGYQAKISFTQMKVK